MTEVASRRALRRLLTDIVSTAVTPAIVAAIAIPASNRNSRFESQEVPHGPAKVKSYLARRAFSVPEKLVLPLGVKIVTFGEASVKFDGIARK